MSKSEADDFLILVKIDGKYYTLEPKPTVNPELAGAKRRIIFSLFKDHHVLKEVEVAAFTDIMGTN